MNLWIRSQDKRALKKVDDLYINLLGCLAKEDELYWITDKNIKLGGYKTEKRALEVLDEIQSAIEYKGDCYYKKEEDALCNIYGVYEMPKE
ncbi:MAG: hypothetical protein HFI86_02140 [Bacilli bacterium]|nr:hypothetical protein [Bacilli bacterium]